METLSRRSFVKRSGMVGGSDVHEHEFTLPTGLDDAPATLPYVIQAPLQ